MYLLLFLIAFFILLILVKNQIELEPFYPAWNNHVLYNELSKRLRIGIWKEWIHRNHLQFMDKLIQLTNSEIRIYESNKELLQDLLVEKKIDIAFTTEADYGFFLLDHLKNDLSTQVVTLETLDKNKQFIQEKFHTRRLFTLYPLYRVFLTNYFRISKPEDINNKTIQITNVSNNLYRLDLELLKKYRYRPVYKEEEQTEDKYENIKSLFGKIDGYFTDFNNPDEHLFFLSNNTNISLIDIQKESIEKDFFFMKKDTMDLRYYPTIVHRRKQTIDFYNQNYDPQKLQCYSYKTVLLTRKDVNDEAIYLFTKKLHENFELLKKNIPYFEKIQKKELYNSIFGNVVPLHPAVFIKK